MILDAHAEMSGTVFDLPHAIEGAKAYLSNAGVADRCDFIAGDFFEIDPRRRRRLCSQEHHPRLER